MCPDYPRVRATVDTCLVNLTQVSGTPLTPRDWSTDLAKLDIALSTRASESTLSAIAGALASKATDKLRVSVVDALPESPLNLTKVAGTPLTARDWSQDLAMLQNLDVLLSTRASESTLSAIKSKTDTLSFDTGNRLRVNIANAEIMVPADLQARYKASLTLYSGTVTSSGNSEDIDLSNYSAVELLLKVTSVSGTSPTLGVYIEGKFEATGDYKTLASQTGITGTGTWFFTIDPLIFRYVRVRWVVGGTSPSFTFGVYAQAMV